MKNLFKELKYVESENHIIGAEKWIDKKWWSITKDITAGIMVVGIIYIIINLAIAWELHLLN